MMINRATGCRPSPPDVRDLCLANYIDTEKLRIEMDRFPAAADWTEATRPDGRIVLPSRSALGNNWAGNCVLAGPAHREIVIGQITGREVDITEGDVIGEYSDCTGFDPVTRDNDNGWTIRDFFKTSAKRAMFGGKMPRTQAYVRIDHTKQIQRVIASWLGVGTIDGFRLPLAAQGQVDDKGRELWFVPPGGWPNGKGPGTWGGHCMWRLAVSPFIDKVWTWGGPAWLRADWSDECCFESWLSLSDSLVMRDGCVPSGFAWKDVLADVRARAQG